MYVIYIDLVEDPGGLGLREAQGVQPGGAEALCGWYRADAELRAGGWRGLRCCGMHLGAFAKVF